MRTMVCACLLALAGCGGTNPAGGAPGGSGGGARIHTRILTPAAPGSGAASRYLPNAVGQSAVTGLTNLSYFITAISVCKGLEVNGSGYSNADGCLALYDNQPPAQFQYTPSMDYSSLAAAARADHDATHFVNLVDPAGRAALSSSTPLSTDDAHDYNWGIINWVPVVKLQADLDVGGQTFHTHDGVSARASFGYQTSSPTAFTDGSAELATVLHSNGGSSFRFQNPLHIDAATLAANQELALDLVFNPDGIIKGFSAGAAGPGQLEDVAGNRIAVPFLTLTPIPHGSGDTVVREAYVLHVSSGGARFDVRVDLYTLGNDPGSTIYGVETETLYTADTTDWVSDFPKIMFIEADSGAGELQFEINPPPGMSGHGPAVLRHFVRAPSGAATVDIACSDPATGGFQVPGCAAGASIHVPVEYLGRSSISG